MRILLYNHEFPPFGGGAGFVTRDLGIYLAKLGHPVTVLTGYYGSGAEHDHESGLEIYRVRYPHGRPPGEYPSALSLAPFIPLSILAAWWLVRQLGIEIINSHLAFPAGVAGLTVSKVLRVPHVASFVGGDVYDPSQQISFLARKLTLRYVALSDRLTANNEELKQRVYRYGIRKPIEVIPYGIDHRHFYPAEGCKERGERVTILSFCRLVPRKGISYLLQAMPQVIEAAGGRVLLKICGDGPLRPQLEEQARQLAITDYVLFCGFIPPQDQVATYNQADIYVLPALHEGFPLGVLEAMACGLPVVASHVGGVPDQVQGNGILVEPANPGELAQALIKLASDPMLRAQMASLSRERVLRYFTWERIGKLYEQFFAETLS